MAKAVRNIPDLLARAAHEQFNAFKRELAAGLSSAKVHADVTSKDDSTGTADLVTSADATDTDSAIPLVNEAKAVLNRHYADDDHAHKSADGALATADATDEATAITLANAIKADYNTHRASTTYHYAADSTNAVAAADATNEASLVTLVNEIKADLNAHIQTGFATRSIKAVPA